MAWVLAASSLGLFIGRNDITFMLPFFYLFLGSLTIRVQRAAGERGGLAGRGFRALLASLLLNCMVFPLARATILTLLWEERSPRPVAVTIEKNVPPGARILGPPAVYYACVRNGNRFLRNALPGASRKITKEMVVKYRRSIRALSPEFMVTAVGESPRDLFPSIGRYERIAGLFRPIRNYGPMRSGSYDLVLWKIEWPDALLPAGR